MRRTLAASILTLGLACAVQACSTPPSARPTTEEPTTGSPRPSALDAHGRTSCGLLSRDQLAPLGLDPTTADDSSTVLASACRWKSTDKRRSLYLVVSVNSPLERVYEALAVNGPLQTFELGGRRAVREGAPRASTCTIYLELAQNQIASVEAATLLQDGTSCDLSEKALDAVVDSLS